MTLCCDYALCGSHASVVSSVRLWLDQNSRARVDDLRRTDCDIFALQVVVPGYNFCVHFAVEVNGLCVTSHAAERAACL